VTQAISLSLALALAAGSKVTFADWMPLIQNGDYQKARSLCERWLHADDPRTRAEGHRCLAEVELGVAGLRSKPKEPATSTVKALDEAVHRSPQDLSVHRARLSTLLGNGRYDELTRDLEESARLYQGRDAMDAWLAYPTELSQQRQFSEAVSLLLVLEKLHPDDRRVARGLSVGYAMLERDEDAIAWGKKAVKLAPDDPVDHWNLARVYDFSGNAALADAEYRRSLALRTGADRKQSTCIYTEFLADRKKDKKRACELQKQAGCPPVACQR